MALLEVEGITVGYTDVPVVIDVSMNVTSDETVVIIGPNGAGKSTLLKAVAGIAPVRGGRVTLLGEDVTRRRPETRSLLGASYVPQGSNVFPELSVLENLQIALPRRTKRRMVKQRIEAIGEQFPEVLRLLPKSAALLSGGQRQIVAVAAALMCEPKLLLMDEPTAGVSPVLARQMFQHIERVRSSGISVLLVEQNARQALGVADRGYVLESGRMAIEGPGQALLSDERTVELYLGRSVT
jgi:branched-chain amino acid transport system ATP-binding protein